MNPNPTETGKRFPHAVAVGLVLLAAVNLLIGSELYLVVALATAGFLVILAYGPPLYRTAIRRTGPNEILCRFVPWYHAVSIVTSLVIPIFGIAVIAAGRAPDNPGWLVISGYFCLFLGGTFGLVTIVQSTNRLSFTPSQLVIRIGRRFEIPRERVVAIRTSRLLRPRTENGTWHYDFVYAPPDRGANRIMAALDMHFSVEPTNLVNALQAWRDGDPDDPRLMDRLESILRGQMEDSH